MNPGVHLINDVAYRPSLGEPHFGCVSNFPPHRLQPTATPLIFIQIISTNDECVQQALESLVTKQCRSIRQAALGNGVARSALGHRWLGRLPRSETSTRTVRLNTEQERTLICYIQDLQLQYQPPYHHQIRLIAQNLADQNGPSKALDINWATGFIK